MNVLDLIIALCYFCIPLEMVFCIKKQRVIDVDDDYRHIAYLFATFILSCGTTHLYGAFHPMHPTTTTSFVLKLVTAIASFFTMIAFGWKTSHCIDDLTAAKKAKTLGILDKLHRYEALLNTDHIVTIHKLDANYSIISANTEFWRVAGWHPEQITGSAMRIVILPVDIDFVYSKLDTFVSDCRSRHHNDDASEHAGSIFWRMVNNRTQQIIHVQSHVQITSNNELVLYTRNLTNEREYTREFQRHLSVEVRLQFISSISHDLKTPLNILQLQYGISPEIDYINCVITQSYEVYKMATLQFVAIPDKTALIVDKLLDRILAFSRMYPKKVSLRVDSNMHFECVRVAEQWVWDIVSNLMTNACKFTNEGEIVIRIDRCSFLQDRVSKSFMRITVEDSGTGISDKTRLFSPFDKMNSYMTAGVGIGLYCINHKINLLGGTIVVKNAINYIRGTLVEVKIPIDSNVEIQSMPTYSAPATSTFFNMQEPPDAKSSVHAHKRFLIIDDSTVLLNLLGILVSRCGGIVETAENGRLALDLINESEPFDYILTDINMPEMDGLEFANEFQRMRSMTQDTLVVAMSANEDEALVRKCALSKMNAFIPKPVTMAKILLLSQLVQDQHFYTVSANKLVQYALVT
jgi:CheY-like chemotaxis protein